MPWGGTIAIGDSVTAYGGPYSPDCASDSTTRTCQSNGLLSGGVQFQSQSCTADGANDCTFDGVLVPYETSLTVYPSPQVVGTCTSGQLKCVHDGGTEFTGTGATYHFTSCVASSAGCNPNDTADLLTSNGTPYTRQCQGSVNLTPPNGMAYNVVLAQFGDVFGFAHEDDNTTGWPGTVEGLSPTFSIHLGQFLSLAFHANPARTIQINQNPSFGSNEIAVTISRRPGVFTANDPDMICANAAGIISSSGFASTTCIFSDDPNETYYLNFALPPDQDCNGATVSCPAAYTPYFVY